jgi:hypothetical protein
MFLTGGPAGRVESDFQKTVLQAGQKQELHFVRTAGQRIQGQVTGQESMTNLSGTRTTIFISLRSRLGITLVRRNWHEPL